MLGVKQVIYKTRKVRDEFCTVCQQFLTGNGSMVNPHKCSCGEYKYSWKEGRYLHPTEGELENE